MSHIYGYNKELASIAQDSKERAAAIRVRRVSVASLIRAPRIKAFQKSGFLVTVPLSYVIASRIKLLLKKKW